jgi:DNA-binding MarR family transcriptional regulator
MAIVSMYTVCMTSHDFRPTPGHLVWLLSMRWRAAVDRTVGPLGLTHAQYSLLASLRELVSRGEEPSQRKLAEFTALDPVHVSKLATGLHRRGLIERRADPTDSRAMCISLTEEGTAVIDVAVVAVRQLMSELTAPLGGLGGAGTGQLVQQLSELLAVADVAAPSHRRPPSASPSDRPDSTGEPS